MQRSSCNNHTPPGRRIPSTYTNSPRHTERRCSWTYSPWHKQRRQTAATSGRSGDREERRADASSRSERRRAAGGTAASGEQQERPDRRRAGGAATGSKQQEEQEQEASRLIGGGCWGGLRPLMVEQSPGTTCTGDFAILLAILFSLLLAPIFFAENHVMFFFD